MWNVGPEAIGIIGRYFLGWRPLGGFCTVAGSSHVKGKGSAAITKGQNNDG